MDVEDIRTYCLSYPQTTEGFPFDESTLVFKVANKMFALLSLDSQPTRINLKCEPEVAEEWRLQHPAIIPGYHMNKKHWNTLILDGSLSSEFIRDAIDRSCRLIVASLPKKIQKELEI